MRYEPEKFGVVKAKGRGTIVHINTQDHPFAKDIKHGDILSFGGTEYEVIGIERSWKPMHPPILGDNFGFVVKERD